MARNPRAAAQRATARAVREQRTRLPVSINRGYQQARMDWAHAVMRGDIPMPAPGTMEAKNLASLAGKASWGKADPAFERAFSKYWYHHKEQNMGPDADRYEEGDESDADYEDDADYDSGEEEE